MLCGFAPQPIIGCNLVFVLHHQAATRPQLSHRNQSRGEFLMKYPP